MKPQVLVVGSINRDLVTTVDTLPVPGQTVFALGTFDGLGGKGANQAVAAARMGASTTLLGAVGDDPAADQTITELAAEGLDTSAIQRIPDCPTGRAYVTVDRTGENSIVVVTGANGRLDTALAADRVSRFLEHARPHRPVVLMQGELGGDSIDRVVALATPHAVPVILNLAPIVTVRRSTLSAVDLLILNTVEAGQLLDENPTEAPYLAARLAHRHGTTVIVTAGARGAAYATTEDVVWTQPAAPVERVVDTTGAGDTFAGTLAAEIAAGHGLRDAVRMATAAAGLAVQTHGTVGAGPDRPTVIRALAATPQPQTTVTPYRGGDR
ncbi:ribokinase [Rhizohabitans arisaemae]|uniref:ribokinase n=1 Tax=Rhizohabitans arisaemae TaxID=2720610 RepID=UPI0024B0B249|nr:ribokinase [Rhizohabitans arisaemae]